MIFRLIAYFALLALYTCGCAVGIAAGCGKRTIAVFGIVGIVGMLQLYTY